MLRSYIWTHTFNNSIAFSLGGSYTFDGKTYTEIIKFGSANQSVLFGRNAVYKVRFEGNKMHISGGVENDPRIFNEIWERVE